MAADAPNDAMPHKRCLGCGYILDGLPENRCPECGREFDANDPGTFQVAYSRRAWWFWANPPRWWGLLPVAVCGAWFIYRASEPPQFLLRYFGMPCLGLLLVGLCCLDYLVRLIVVIAACRKPGYREDGAGVKQWWRWVVPPLVVILMFSGDWPMRLRFAISRPAFERAARAALVGNPPATPGWVGSYYVERVYAAPEGIVYFQTGYDFADYVGFVYRPEETTAKGYQRLAPAWYMERW
jgi:hypothetical protein